MLLLFQVTVWGAVSGDTVAVSCRVSPRTSVAWAPSLMVTAVGTVGSITFSFSFMSLPFFREMVILTSPAFFVWMSPLSVTVAILLSLLLQRLIVLPGTLT